MMLRRALPAALALEAGCGLLPPAAAHAISVQEALLRAKPAVVLVIAEVSTEVTLDCGSGPTKVKPPAFRETGTGWFIDGDGWVITNGHVVQPAHATPQWVLHEQARSAVRVACLPAALRRAGLTTGEQPEAEDAIRRRLLDGALPTAQVTATPNVSIVSSNGTRLTAEVTKYSPPVGSDRSGRDLVLLKVPGDAFPVVALAGSEDAKIGDPIHIIGFPGVVLTHELLSQSGTIEASVTTGAVSGFRRDKADNRVIQTDASAAWGNSGGPAVNEEGAVLGVLTFVSLGPGPEGGIVQGFNFIIPSEAVKEFVKDTPLHLGSPGKFNPAWRAGLRAFFSDDWKGALGRFQEADRIRPNLPDVKRMLAEAQENVAHPAPRPFPWAWTTLGIGVLSAGCFGGLAARHWWRNRFRVTPAQLIRLIERGNHALFLDVRTKTDYGTSPLVLPGAVRSDPDDLEAGHAYIDTDAAQLIVTYCTTPGEATSARAARQLRHRGYRNVRILKGGLGGWVNAHLPIEGKSHLPAVAIEIYKDLALRDVERRRFTAGEVVFRQGDDPKGEAFVVHAGVVEVRRWAGETEQAVARLGEGELFGELALFRHGPRTAAAVAATDVELLVIRAERLEWLIRNRPQVTIEILSRMADIAASS
jgi:S1-C subfamily serine protease/rhodanese-related sulfurtransferase